MAYVKGALELAQEQKERNIQEHQERQQNYTTSKQIESLLNSKVVSNKDTRNLNLFLTNGIGLQTPRQIIGPNPLNKRCYGRKLGAQKMTLTD